VRDETGGDIRVTVVPVTHSVPSDPADAVEIPAATKRRLRLDDARSWVVTTEVNDFVWPGPDLRSVPHEQGRFDYGFLPPSLFRQIRDRLTASAAAQRLLAVPRT
jgi:hypothetical protein